MLFRSALNDVYQRRIERGKEAFNTKKLGAIGAELAILSGFFDPPWSKPVEGLRDSAKAFVLNEAGYDLRALGRLAEAAEPMEASLEMRIRLKDWKNSASASSNLSELYLTMGDLERATKYAEQSVKLADRSGDELQKTINRPTHADALHQAGRVSEAEAIFREAEKMQKALQPQIPLLYSLRGFNYCGLLLAKGEHREVQERAARTLEWAKNHLGLLAIALDCISLGRAHLLQAMTEGSRDYSQAAMHLNQAVEGLRKAGNQNHLPRGLLAWAELRRLNGELTRAQADLDEAMSIATRGGMDLYKADCHLEYARLHLARRDKDQARASLATAKEMIERMGYHRRDKDVEETYQQLKA